MSAINSAEGLEEIRKAATARGWIQPERRADWVDPSDATSRGPARVTWDGQRVALYGADTETYRVVDPVEWLIDAIDEAYPLPAEPVPDPAPTPTTAAPIEGSAAVVEGPSDPTVGSPEGRAMIGAEARLRGWVQDEDGDWIAHGPDRPRNWRVLFHGAFVRVGGLGFDRETEAIDFHRPVSEAIAAIRRLCPLPSADAREGWTVDDLRSDLAAARAAAEGARRASNGMAEKLIAARNTNEDLRAELGHAKASIREATHTLATALDHDTEAALVLETAAEEVVRRWRRDRETLAATTAENRAHALSHQSAIDRIDWLTRELAAIDAALGLDGHPPEDRSPGDRVARIREEREAAEFRMGAVRHTMSTGHEILRQQLADVDAALDGHIRPDGDRAQSIRDLVAGRQRPESPYLARLEGALMARDPELFERIRRG